MIWAQQLPSPQKPGIIIPTRDIEVDKTQTAPAWDNAQGGAWMNWKVERPLE